MNSELKNLKANMRYRSAFTLIELMFVIAIIAVLSSLAVAVMQTAQEDAKESATRSRIVQIEALMQIVMEDYEVRRLPVRNAILAAYVKSNPIAAGKFGAQLKNLRRRIVVQMIRAEIMEPYRQGNTVAQRELSSFEVSGDLGHFVSGVGVSVLGTTAKPPEDARDDVPVVNMTFSAWLDANYPNPVLGRMLKDYLEANITSEMQFWGGVAGETIPPVDPGELLYRILERISIDGSSALELLGGNIVGDPDEDGVPDIVDAYGASMGLRLVQVDVNLVGRTPADDEPPNENITFSKPAEDLWVSKETNWNLRGAKGLPRGYVNANPVVPRAIHDLRFQVVSSTLEAREIQ